ncbi:MAG: DUF2911 domain-containing protein [Bacteroidia bacterium]
MTTTKKIILASALAFSSLYSTFAQTLKVPAPSPSQTIKQSFGLGDVTIDYSRPGVKDRVVFGDLVPYGKTWRTGANATTKITITDDIMIEGKALAPGTYGIYTVPNKDEWDIMIYKDVTLGGNVAAYKAEDELFRVKVKPTALSNKVENFTIEFADLTPTSCVLELLWDKTRVPVKITCEIDSKVMKNIEATVSADKRPYFQAASYYYDNDKDMNKALEWANKAAEQNPKAYWVLHLKAKIQVKLKDYKGAIATAEQSMALAKAENDDAYVRNNEKLIAETKKKS